MPDARMRGGWLDRDFFVALLLAAVMIGVWFLFRGYDRFSFPLPHAVIRSLRY